MPSVKKNYKYPLDWYARQYNLSTSTVARYQKEGAPFDHPDKFIKWMAPRSRKPKHMREGPGVRDLRVDRGAKNKAKIKEIAADLQKASHDQKSEQQARVRPIIEGGGLRVEIARQESECAHAYKLYREAIDNNEHLDAMALHKIWIGAQEQLRKLSKDVPKSEKDDDKALPVGDVEYAWRNSLSQMKTMLENIPSTVSLGLTGVAPETRIQLEKAMMDEIVIVVSAMRETPWLK